MAGSSPPPYSPPPDPLHKYRHPLRLKQGENIPRKVLAQPELSPVLFLYADICVSRVPHTRSAYSLEASPVHALAESTHCAVSLPLFCPLVALSWRIYSWRGDPYSPTRRMLLTRHLVVCCSVALAALPADPSCITPLPPSPSLSLSHLESPYKCVPSLQCLDSLAASLCSILPLQVE